MGEWDGLKVAVGSCVGVSDGVCVGFSNEGGNVGETQMKRVNNHHSVYQRPGRKSKIPSGIIV